VNCVRVVSAHGVTRYTHASQTTRCSFIVLSWRIPRSSSSKRSRGRGGSQQCRQRSTTRQARRVRGHATQKALSEKCVSYNAAMSLRVLAASAISSFRLAKATRLRRPCLVRTRIASQPSGPRTSGALNEKPQPIAGLREVERRQENDKRSEVGFRWRCLRPLFTLIKNFD
jgi:hypothetical protein